MESNGSMRAGREGGRVVYWLYVKKRASGGESERRRESVYIFHGTGLHDFLNPEYEAGFAKRENDVHSSFLTRSAKNRHAIVQAAL